MKKIILILSFSFYFVFVFAQNEVVDLPKGYSKFVHRDVKVSLDYMPYYTTQSKEELKVFLYALSFLSDSLLFQEGSKYSFTFQFKDRNWDVFLEYVDDVPYSIEFISWVSIDNEHYRYQQIKIGTLLDYVYKRRYNKKIQKIEIFDYPQKTYTEAYNYSDILNDYFALLYSAQDYIISYVDSHKKELRALKKR